MNYLTTTSLKRWQAKLDKEEISMQVAKVLNGHINSYLVPLYEFKPAEKYKWEKYKVDRKRKKRKKGQQ